MTKETKDIVFAKFNGLCAYTGKPLDEKWQIDHQHSKQKFAHSIIRECKSGTEFKERMKVADNINNLFPAISIINHYKRGFDLEGFRFYMINFHNRLSRLPKNTALEKTKKRIEYMNMVANLFDITIDKPFNGIFYFETINQ